MAVICIENHDDFDDGSPSSLPAVFDAFFQALEAATIPHPQGRVICDIPGAVLLSDYALRLFHALGMERAVLFKRAQPVPLQPDGSLQISKNTSIAVQGSNDPQDEWTNLKGPGVRASALEVSPIIAKDLAIIKRAHEVVGFPIQRWNELQARKPGGPHQRYQFGDVITHDELAVLESIRRLSELPADLQLNSDDRLKQLRETTPPFDRKSGLWIRNVDAAGIEGVETETLRSYRKLGIQSADGSLGRDNHGRIWRRPGTRSSHPWYLRATLKKKSR